MTKSITVPRKQVLLSALTNNYLKISTKDGIYRIDPHDALERMLNGHKNYKLTTKTVSFTGSIDISNPEIQSRMESRNS